MRVFHHNFSELYNKEIILNIKIVIIYSFVHLMADINYDKNNLFQCIYKYLNKILLQLNYQ